MVIDEMVVSYSVTKEALELTVGEVCEACKFYTFFLYIGECPAMKLCESFQDTYRDILKQLQEGYNAIQKT